MQPGALDAVVKDGVLDTKNPPAEMTPPCVLVDFVPNFFLAKTESLLKLQWDNNLKVNNEYYNLSVLNNSSSGW